MNLHISAKFLFESSVWYAGAQCAAAVGDVPTLAELPTCPLSKQLQDILIHPINLSPYVFHVQHSGKFTLQLECLTRVLAKLQKHILC